MLFLCEAIETDGRRLWADTHEQRGVIFRFGRPAHIDGSWRFSGLLAARENGMKATD